MPKLVRVIFWIAVSLLGAFALATIALHRGEQINALWLVVAAVSTYAVGYRFYSSFISAKVLALDPLRALPPSVSKTAATSFPPTSGWSSGTTSPHRRPRTARRSSPRCPVRLPAGTLWIIAAQSWAVRAGFRHPALFRPRDGKSLTAMAKSEIGRVGGS